MITFKTLVDSGVNPLRHTSWGTATPTQDMFIRNYNNKWGVATDTHMDMTENGDYIITGSMVRDKANFDKLLGFDTWRNVEFGQSLERYIDDNGKVGAYAPNGGDVCYLIKKK